jgi:hypothetical protein
LTIAGNRAIINSKTIIIVPTANVLTITCAFFVYFYCTKGTCLTWNRLCSLQVYLFVHWCGSYRLPRVSVWLHRIRDKKHLLLVLRILIMCLFSLLLIALFSFLGKMPCAMHKPPKLICDYVPC